MTTTFRGWPAAAFDFYAELEANNDRSWWQAHRATYDEAVKAPFAALTDAVEAEFGPMRLFRPNRDTRFSKDKAPYKTNAAAMTESDGGAAYYLSLGSDGLMVGVGMYHLASDQLQRYRDALADDRRGGALADLVAGLERKGYEVMSAEALKTAPRGWDKDHPRIDLARRKGLAVGRSFPRAAWQSSAKALDRIVGVWRDAAPFAAWLDTNVGPSELPPPEPR